MEVNDIRGILVEQDGIRDRLAYLDCCVVFRFCSQDSIDWPRFRRWANRNWGSSLNAPIQKLDDDLWLLFCDSKAKVARILSLNRSSFGDISIQLDKWIPEAGRSSVLAGQKVSWITIRGIPIHLRSSDLFRQIGSVCGIYLGFEVCSSLSSVRIKISRVGDLPEVVPILFEGRQFPVQVLPDPDSSLKKDARNEACPKGKAVAGGGMQSGLYSIPLSSFAPSRELDIGASSSSPAPIFSADHSSVTVSGIRPERTPGSSRPHVLKCQKQQSEENIALLSEPAVSGGLACSVFNKQCSLVGLNLVRVDNFWFVSSFNWGQSAPLAKLYVGLERFGPLFQTLLSPSKEWAIPKEWASVTHFPQIVCSAEDSAVGEIVSIDEAAPFQQLGIGGSLPDMFPPLPGARSSPSSPPPRLHALSSSTESDLLHSVVKQAASLFGLELQGDRSLGAAAADVSCSEISSRISRSRKDREWHRLGFTPESPLMPRTRSSSRTSCSSPTQSNDI
ncbi:hypothetical protein LINPERHAP1_LOCUS27810 [Linum perenne]